jgi:hypothetical protein
LPALAGGERIGVELALGTQHGYDRWLSELRTNPIENFLRNREIPAISDQFKHGSIGAEGSVFLSSTSQSS